MIKQLLAGCLLLVATGVFAQSTDRLLACGGPFGPDLNIMVLFKAFGKANVKPESVYVGEGSYQAATVLFGSSPEDRVEILEHDVPRRVHFVIVQGEKSNWRTPHGLTLGMRLREVERMNGGPFRLRGFDFDLGGATLSWSGGRLESKAPGCEFHARLRPGKGRPDASPDERRLHAQVSGDGDFSSGHPAMQSLDPMVDRIALVQYKR